MNAGSAADAGPAARPDASGDVPPALAVEHLCVGHRELGTFIEDDAEKMMAVAEAVFRRLAVRHRLTDREAVLVVRGFAAGDLAGTLRRMHAATDREAFAEHRLSPLVEEAVVRRGAACLPSALPVTEE